MMQVILKFRHGCEFSRLSSKHPKITMAHWCNFRTEFLEFESSDQKEVEEIRASLGRLSRHGFKILGGSSDNTNSHVVVMKCAHFKGRTIPDRIEDQGCLVLYPVVYRDGWESYRMISFDEKRLRSLFRQLEEEGEVRLTMKEKINEGPIRHSLLISIDELLSNLTSKQATALQSAIEAGYYSVPRKTSFGEVASGLSIPRTTFEEHVRKAESKVINSVAPYVSLYISEHATSENRRMSNSEVVLQ